MNLPNIFPNQKFMHYALNLAKAKLGKCAPNPVVACVVVKNGEIVASATTADSGRPHAEKIAIEKVLAKKNGAEILRDAEIYVTLEPCSHFGQTPPCADQIIASGIKKVAIATQDPNPLVDGKGIEKLRQASIDVVCGVLEKEAQEINRGFFFAQKLGRPFVTLKLATSLDGKIATKNFASKWITSEKSRQFAHLLRAKNDAILVGANTIRRDDPSLDCRVAGLEEFSPKRVIISQSLQLNSQAKIFQNCEKIPTLILTKNSAEKKSFPFAELIFCAEKNGKIDLNDALQKLCQSGVNSVLVEGGKNLATQLLQENLVDELVWIQSEKIIGSDGISAIDELGIEKISDALDGFKMQNFFELEGDVAKIFAKSPAYKLLP